MTSSVWMYGSYPEWKGEGGIGTQLAQVGLLTQLIQDDSAIIQ